MINILNIISLLSIGVGVTQSFYMQKTIHGTYSRTSTTAVTSCLKHIIQENFINPGFLVLACPKEPSAKIFNIRRDVLKFLHKTEKYAVEITNPDDIPIFNNNVNINIEFWSFDPFNFTPTADYFLIILDNYEDFTYIARKIIRSRFWNPQAQFIIILFQLNNTDTNNKRTAERILSCLFKFNVVNVIICIPSMKNVLNTLIYSWQPYDPPNFCGHFNETAENRTIVLNYCENGKVKYVNDLWINKLPLDMQGCTLRILALERQPFVSINKFDPNIEKWLINLLFKKFNFSVEYEIINAFRGERNEKGLWNGALKELSARKGHILLGGIFPDYDVHEDFECSSSYLSDSYTWIVPRAYPSPPWVSLHIIFQNLVWFSAIAGFITCVLTWVFLGHLSKDSNYNQSFGHCFLNTWLCLLGLVAYVRPNKESLRVFFVFLNLYCIIFLTAYQTKLIDMLQNPSFQDQIDTVEKLLQTDLKIGGSEELHDLFYNSTDPFDQLIDKKWITISNMTKAMHDVAVNRNLSVLCSRFELVHLSSVLPELSDSNGHNNYYAFPLNAFSVPLEIIALRGFPFIREISRDLNKYKQLGINAKVRNYFNVLSMRKRSRLVNTSKIEGKFYALSVQHLQGGFFALAVGAFGGLIVLIFELLSTTTYTSRQRQLKGK
uniref:Ionotropic receptor 60a n=1 Tax=Heliconius melpomene rosina TaxID=171916 RepID=A0A140G9G5_HELME|nr:ionotropic receptor 60a [Heliconius melpomene rosina]